MTRNLRVSGMNCEGCERNVVASLEDVRGVEDASADHESGAVRIEGDPSDEDVRRAIEDAGYALETQ